MPPCTIQYRNNLANLSFSEKKFSLLAENWNGICYIVLWMKSEKIKKVSVTENFGKVFAEKRKCNQYNYTI